MNIAQIIKHPVITEKTTQSAKSKVYAFEVHEDANKHQIAETVEQLFKVKVATVRITIRKGKEKRVGRKMKTTMLPDRKIAYVYLKEGTIDLFPQN